MQRALLFLLIFNLGWIATVEPALAASPPCDGVETLVGPSKTCLKPGAVFRDCQGCPEMVVVPAGGFTMGSPRNEKDRDPHDEGPQHWKTIPVPFAMGRFEVTRGEFAVFAEETRPKGETFLARLVSYLRAVFGREESPKHEGNCYFRAYVGGNPVLDRQANKSWRNPGFDQDDQHPVVCVSWHDAKAYAAWLSRKTGQWYRLLTEVEWEYAARAGTTTRFYFGDEITEHQANFGDHFGGTTEVGRFPANAWGLHDMHGNAYEWVEDCWQRGYPDTPPENCGDRGRRLRGGCWAWEPYRLRSAARSAIYPTLRLSMFGFRVARTL